MPRPMATLAGSGTQPPAGPSTSQTSRNKSQEDSSAARCRAFKGRKHNLLKGEQVAKGWSQPENTPACNRVAFEYSAGKETASISTSTINTTRRTAPTTRNAASFLHYLQRKIKLTISSIDSYNRGLESGVNVFNSKISSYACNLDSHIQLLNASKFSHSDVERDIQRLKEQQNLYIQDIDTTRTHLNETRDTVTREFEDLNARKDEFDVAKIMEEWKADTSLDADELERRIEKLTARKDDFEALNKRIQEGNATKDAYFNYLDMQMKLLIVKMSHTDDVIDKQMQLLSAKLDLLAENLVRQVQKLNARKDSYTRDLEKRIHLFSHQITSYDHNIRRQFELVNSKKAPFAQDLDKQLKLLDSKIAAFYHNFKRLQDLLNSNLNSYFNDVDRKMELLNSGMASYLGRDIPLLKE